jgi:hypothetical protein
VVVELRLASGVYLVRVMKDPAIGFEWKAEHEICGGQGCWECDHKQYRDLTEDEENEVYLLRAQDGS